MTTGIKILHWAPRILAILAILFISLFALDSFGEGMTIGQQIVAFLLHMIPSFILIILLVVAWKWELVGGLIYAGIGLILTPFIFIHNYRVNDSLWISFVVILTITIPFILVGFLFIMSYRKKKNQRVQETP